MKFQIDDPKVKAVLSELASRLKVKEEIIVRVAMKELTNQYITKPTLATQVVKMALKREGIPC